MAVQALEHLEYLRGIAGIDPDAVVIDGELPGIAALLRADMHPRRVRAAELERVGQQVAEHLLELAGVALHHRQGIVGDRRPALGDRGIEIRQ
jgi:hypothetical protein